MSSKTWLVTGANRGMGLEWVTQVDIAGSAGRYALRPAIGSFLSLQILALENTIVIAAGRPIDDFQELEKLQEKYAGKLKVVEMELLQPDTIKVKALWQLHTMCTPVSSKAGPKLNDTLMQAGCSSRSCSITPQWH